MMNQSKKNNGWILCPSKSFPGKFYYFNVVNGETAWSLNEIENQNLKREYRIQKVADRSHSFPEPSSPPHHTIDNTPNTSFYNNSLFKKTIYNTTPKQVINNAQSPMFGQAIFPKYVEPFMSNVIWTPIQLPSHMFVPTSQDMAMKMPSDRFGQPRDSDSGLFVQACSDLSLSKRFKMYAKQSNVNNKPDNMDFFNKFYETSTPIKSSSEKIVMDNHQIFGLKEVERFQKAEEFKSKSFLREPVLKRVRSHSESENESRALSSIDISNSGNMASYENTVLKSSLSGGNKVEISNNEEKHVDLDCNDLRFLLVAKRRKSVASGELYRSSEGKKNKPNDEIPTPKKRVTFDLGDQVSSDGAEERTEENIEIPSEDFASCDQEVEDTLLYLVVDLDTLLEEYEFIEEYVLSEDNRRLLVPHKLRMEMEAVCVGDCRGRQRIIAARQITRKLVNPPTHYVLLPETEDSPNSGQFIIVDNQSENYILNACLQVLNAGDRVMLVTNNTDLYNDAKELNIDCFDPQELKNDARIAKPEISFQLRKVQINNNDKKSNLYMQPASDFQSCLARNKEEIPENSLKKRILDRAMKGQSNIPKTKDANTSPIDTKLLDVGLDRLIDITRKKIPSMPHIDHFDNQTAEIGEDMQNLFIKEKPNKNQEATEKQNVQRFENGSEKRKECNQRVFEPQSSNVNTLDSILSVYRVKDKDMEENIKLRMDEWTCCFTQFMENALIDILMKYSPITDKVSPPWVLYESLRTVQHLYGSHTKVTMVAQKLKDMLLNNSSKIGNLKSSTKPNDLVKIVGCGLVLIEYLKSIKPTTSLQEASNSITNLLQDMSQPAPDIPFNTPVLNTGNDTVKEERRNYIKKPSEIIEYLKTHFTEWKDFVTPDDKPTVVRTCGRDLSLLKIDNDKSITLNTRSDNFKSYGNTVPKVSTMVDGITSINYEKLPKYNSECDNSNTKAMPVDFKFDRFYKIGNDINIKENVLFNTYNAEFGNIQNTKEIKEKLQIAKSNNPSTSNSEPKIMRFFDKIFKQDNEKINNVTKDDLNVPKHGYTFNQNTETAGQKIIRTFDNLFPSKSDDKTFATLIDELSVPKHGNTFNLENETAGPKVIRNIEPIEEFEGKLKENSNVLDLDALDYSEIDRSPSENDEDSISTVSFVYPITKYDRKRNFTYDEDKNVANIDNNKNDSANTNNIDVIMFNDDANDSLMNCSALNDSDDKFRINDETTDSGFENESIHAYTLVKIFLAELSESVKAIYEFIVKSINEYLENDVPDEKKRLLHDKANRTQLVIAGIIVKLKSIIQRESDEGSTIKGMLLKAGLEASSDKRITRYRQVVTKCLEQAQILENALNTVLRLTDDLQDSISSHSDTQYFNIFE